MPTSTLRYYLDKENKWNSITDDYNSLGQSHAIIENTFQQNPPATLAPFGKARLEESQRLKQRADEIIEFFNKTPFYEPVGGATSIKLPLTPAAPTDLLGTSTDPRKLVDEQLEQMRAAYLRLLHAQQAISFPDQKPIIQQTLTLWKRRNVRIAGAVVLVCAVILGLFEGWRGVTYGTGQTAFAESRWEDAINSFTPLYRILGPYRDSQRQLVSSFSAAITEKLENGEWDTARTLAESFLAVGADNATAQRYIRDVFYFPALEAFSAENYIEVRALLDQIPGELDTDTETLYQLSMYAEAVIASQQEPPDWDTAEQILRNIIARPSGSTNNEVLSLLVDRLIVRANTVVETQTDENRWQDARNILDETRQTPLSAAANALEARDTFFSTYYLPAVTLLENGDYAGARSIFEELIALPENGAFYRDTTAKYHETYYDAGRAFMNAEDFEAARAEFQALIELDAETGYFPDAGLLLRRSYLIPAQQAVDNANWESALDLLEPLYRLESSYSNTATLLSLVYYELGTAAITNDDDLATAQRYLEQLQSINPLYRDLQTILSDLYYTRATNALAAASDDITRWTSARPFLTALDELNSNYRDSRTLLRESFYVPANVILSEGIAALDVEQCVEARELLEASPELSDYKNTPTLLNETYYCEVLAAIEADDLETARTALTVLHNLSPSYRDIESLFNQIYYLPAQQAMENQDWQTARDLLRPLLARESFYRDAFLMLRNSYYIPGSDALAAGDWTTARSNFMPLIYGENGVPAIDPNYLDVQTLLRESYYRPASQAMDDQDWDAARQALIPLIYGTSALPAMDPNYRDVQTLLRESYYRPASQAMDDHDWDTARQALIPLIYGVSGRAGIDPEYQDIQTLLRESYYRPATQAMDDQDWEAARQALIPLIYGTNERDAIDPNYNDVQTLLRESYYRPATQAMAEQDWNAAREALLPLIYDTNGFAAIDPENQDIQTLLRESYYRPASQAMVARDWQTVRDNLTHLLELDAAYEDAQTLLYASYYTPGQEALERQDWNVARTNLHYLVDSLEQGEYEDADDLLLQSYLQPGQLALESADWGEARENLAIAFQRARNDDEIRRLLEEAFLRPANMAFEARDWETTRQHLDSMEDANLTNEAAADLYRETYLTPVRFLTESGDLSAAREGLDRFRQRYRDDVSVYRDLLLLTYSRPLNEAITREDWYSATELFLQLREENPEDNTINAVVAEYSELRTELVRRYTPLWRDVDLEATIRTVRGHNGAVNQSIFNGLRLVSGGSDGSIRLWTPPNEQSTLSILTNGGAITDIVTDPNAVWMATVGSGRIIQIWDMQTGLPIIELDQHTDWVNTIAASSDGQWLASGGDDNSVLVWSSADWNAAPRRFNMDGHVTAVQFSPDNSNLAVATDNVVTLELPQQVLGTLETYLDISMDAIVILLDLQTETVIGTTEPTAFINEIAFHPSGTFFVTIGNEPTAHIWSLTGEMLTTLAEHSDWIRGVDFNTDGSLLATVGADGRLYLWDTSTWQIVNTLIGLASPYSVSFSLDGSTLVVGTGSGDLVVWSLSELLVEQRQEGTSAS